jgi:hypothetical protein
MAKVIELILTAERRGSGTPESVCRLVQQLYTKDGYIIAEFDPCGVRHADNTYEPASWMREVPS